jgi:hypothetical protein
MKIKVTILMKRGWQGAMKTKVTIMMKRTLITIITNHDFLKGSR